MFGEVQGYARSAYKHTKGGIARVVAAFARGLSGVSPVGAAYDDLASWRRALQSSSAPQDQVQRVNQFLERTYNRESTEGAAQPGPTLHSRPETNEEDTESSENGK